MPWVNKGICVGCGVCVEECPVDAILMEDTGTAVIDMEECIRCGTCHDICPQEAVRHDSENIPQRISDNIENAKKLLKKCMTEVAKNNYIDKLKKNLKMESKIAIDSAEKIEELRFEK